MKSIEERFAEVERRVRALVAENADLKRRVQALSAEVGNAQRESQGLQHLHGKKMHVQEKIERILRALDELAAREEG